MGANEEVGQHLRLAAAAPAVLDKRLRGQEQGRPRYLAQFQGHRQHHAVEGFEGRERHRHLGVDDRVDGQGMQLGLRSHLGDGPIGPLRVVLQHVHQDVGVDKDHQSSARSSFISSSVRQCTSARPRTASKRSRTGARVPFAALGG